MRLTYKWDVCTLSVALVSHVEPIGIAARRGFFEEIRGPISVFSIFRTFFARAVTVSRGGVLAATVKCATFWVKSAKVPPGADGHQTC